MLLVAAKTAEYVPALQEMHVSEPLLALYVPEGHGVHASPLIPE
jgi:hypothetical protein